MSLGPYDLERGVRPKRVLKAIKELDNDLRDIIKITDPIDLDYDGKTLSGGEIDFLKMDCEGGEVALIGDESIRYVKHFSMEFHPNLMTDEEGDKLLGWLKKYFKVNRRSIKVGSEIWDGTRLDKSS